MEKYELLNQIGDGTFGSVAKAVNKKTGQLVAIKKMKQKYYSWEECVKLPEVDVVRRIHGHPNIVKLREVIRENNELFFVFEFMDGDLLGVIKKAKQSQKPETAATSPAIPYHKVKSYMRQLLQSLAYIHKRGYFHRDLKPENLLIKRENQDEILKLADFGLVKEIRARPPFTDYVSTRWYRAPELLLQDRNYSSPVDIWAAACIMCELVTTKPLFPGSNEVDQLFKIMNVLSSPTEKNWPTGMVLAKKIRYSFPHIQGSGLSKVLPSHFPPQALDLLEQMLTYDPKKRPSAEQCLQHPYFNVGIDDGGNPISVASMDQLANAARRLQQSPQSAPAAMQNVSPENQEKSDKLMNGNSSFSLASPQKLYTYGQKKRNSGAGMFSPKRSNLLSPKNSKVSSEAPSTEKEGPSPKDDKLESILSKNKGGLGALNLANVKVSTLTKNDQPALSTPEDVNTPPLKDQMANDEKKNVTKTDLDLDLDGLMDEFASEMVNEGLMAQKERQSDNTLPPVKKADDPVSSLLSNVRYKKEPTEPMPRIALKNVKTTTNISKNGAGNCAAPPTDSVSPSIKALLAKYRM